MATLNYADSYQAALQEGFFGGLFSQDLWNSPSNNLVKFDGAKHIKVPKLTIDEGRKDRARRTITTPVANYSNDWDTYELTNERYWSTLVDPSDIDETNYVTSISNITRVFNENDKIPEMDRQMFSSLYQRKLAADDGGITTDTLSTENILGAFDDIMERMDEKRIPQSGRIMYVTPKINKILKEAENLTRTINVEGFNGSIKRSVRSLDDVKIVSVPSDLMQTMYDFTVGSAVVEEAEQIEMFIIYNGIQLAPQKYQFAGLDTPSAANSGQYLYYENSYDDVFLLNNKTAGIEFVIAAAETDGPGKIKAADNKVANSLKED